MRKSFNGLSGLVINHKELQCTGEEVAYMFVNKRRDKLKIMHWSSSGLLLYYKRLEEGTFKFPKYEISNSLIALSYTETIMLIDGISIVNVKKNKRYSSIKIN